MSAGRFTGGALGLYIINTRRRVLMMGQSASTRLLRTPDQALALPVGPLGVLFGNCRGAGQRCGDEDTNLLRELAP
jgi:hypothetical protein